MTAQTLKRPYSTSHRLEAERAERARMTDECRGYSPAVRATLAWVITATEPAAKGTNLSNWQDEFLWRAARAAFAKNRQALDNLHDGIGLRLTHGEAIAIYNGVMASHCDSLPTGRDAFEILDTVWAGYESQAPTDAIATALGLTSDQVERITADIGRKQRTTQYLRTAPLHLDAGDIVAAAQTHTEELQ